MRPISAIAALCISLALGFGQTNPADSLEKYKRDLEANPSSSLAHYQIAQIYFQQKNYQSAANEFREALNGDLQPPWIEAQAHIGLGDIFNLTGQFERAENEYRLAQAVPRPVNIYKTGVVAPKILQKTEPEYSDEARLAGLEGAVALSGTITDQGLAEDMKVTQSLGFGLDEKALDAIHQWRFEPGTVDGLPAPVAMTVRIEFHLPDKQSRWHLIRADFTPAEGASRPQFSKTSYPYGVGISLRAFEEALVIRAIGREATAKVTFDVDEHGSPVNFQVLNASHPIWGPEALAVVRDWQFVPGMKSGAPSPVPCILDLLWGPTNLNQQSLEWAEAQLNTFQNADVRVPVRDFRSPAVIYRAPDPPYTESARKAGLQGTVRISLVVGPDGTPQNLRVMSPLGLGLDESAIEAVSRWRFSPSLVNGQPTAMGTVVEVNFHLPR
jgi:TonB family protein